MNAAPSLPTPDGRCRPEPSLPAVAARIDHHAADVAWRSRPMRLADFDAVMDIEAQCYPFPWTRGNFVDAVASGYEAHLLLDAGGRPVGHAVAMVGFEELHVLNIAVLPSLQGTGGGRYLLRLLLDLCAGCGARSVWLEVRVGNERARHVYAQAGFTPVGLRRGYYPAADGKREDAVVMRRPAGTWHGVGEAAP